MGMQSAQFWPEAQSSQKRLDFCLCLPAIHLDSDQLIVDENTYGKQFHVPLHERALIRQG